MIKALDQRELAAVSSNKGVVLAYTDDYVLLKLMDKRFVSFPFQVRKREKHYLRLINSYDTERIACEDWKARYAPQLTAPDEYLDSQK